MRIVASVCLVLAILFMVGCGTSAEDKKMITEQGVKITGIEKKQGDMEKMAAEMSKKLETVWTYLAANNVGKAKFPPEEVKPPEPPKPGTPAKVEPKKEEPKKETKPTTTKGPAPTKTPATGKGG